jgi:outer membrane protein OmpA-like peptidoglycan-associated protein
MIRPTLIWSLFAMLAGPALAEGPAWQYSIVDSVRPGQKAKIVLSARKGAHGVSLTLKSPEGGEKRFTLKRLKAGQKKTLAWKVPAGISHWTGQLIGSAGGATTMAPIELKVVSAKPLNVHTRKKDVDLGKGRIVVRPNHALAKAELTLYGAEGEVLLEEDAALVQEGKNWVVVFEPPDDTIKRVELKLHDPYGYWAALRVVSWYAEIEHDDVEFASAKWDIAPDEGHKIDAAIAKLKREVARFRRELGNESAGVDVRVYVGGYTDTVGKAADNRVLSRKRAAAIARYFVAHGMKVPVYYQGFGEDAPAVPTADDVDEAKNRRAVYVLANVPPRGGQFPGGAWTRLK